MGFRWQRQKEKENGHTKIPHLQLSYSLLDPALRSLPVPVYLSSDTITIILFFLVRRNIGVLSDPLLNP